MKESLISILVPIYNADKYLKRCVESVLSQSFTCWELVLVDDGSTDLSSKLCDEYAAEDERIKTIHKSNGGLPSARLAGYDNAEGEYLLFLDADDYLLPDALKHLYDEINKGYDIVRSRVMRVNDKGESWFEDYKVQKGSFTVEEEYTRSLINDSISPYLHSSIYRASLFTRDAFLPLIENKVSVGEDWVVNYLISKKVKSVSFIEQPTFVYYLNEGSMINTSIRAWKYMERIKRCTSAFNISLSKELKLLSEYRNALTQLQYFFFPEVPFNFEKYRELKKIVPNALNFFGDEIPVPPYYYKYVNNIFLFYIYAKLRNTIFYVFKLHFHKRRELR